MNALFKGLDQYGIGLLITVDEVSASLDEMISFAATYQLFVREGKRVGLLMAGLPHQVSALLRNQTVSSLRRSVQVQRGVALAQGDLDQRVLEPTFYELSDGDLAFLRAMLEDQDVSLVADIAQRMGVASNYASQYRARLVEQGIIGTRGAERSRSICRTSQSSCVPSLRKRSVGHKIETRRAPRSPVKTIRSPTGRGRLHGRAGRPLMAVLIQALLHNKDVAIGVAQQERGDGAQQRVLDGR